jgi:MoxR-like ATPase
MAKKSSYRFYGDPNRQFEVDRDPGLKPEPYIASEELITAVNLALHLNRPLLLEGEAGCGKTRFARAVASELNLPLYVWHVRSSSKAQEGLYSYDAILRLHDVQMSQLTKWTPGGKQNEEAPRRDPQKAADYRRLGPLGLAFQQRDRPAVVLIDEIDKADLDFPNDLLTVLDEPWEFEIPETGERIAADPEMRPLIIVTSNKEKGNLPLPFLRRCVYFFLEFPDNEKSLKKIVEVHYAFEERAAPSDEVVEASVNSFLSIRRDWGLYKKPGTSELLDWLEALRANDVSSEQLINVSDRTPLNYPQLLIKMRADWQRYVSHGR